jgi:hypothetical protein
MSIELIGLILVGGLLLLLALGTEIAVAMGVMASLAFAFIISQPQTQIPWTAWGVLDLPIPAWSVPSLKQPRNG